MKKINNTLENYKLLLLIIFPIIFWATAFPFIKIALEELNPVNLTILRLFLTCFFLLIIIIIFRNRFSKLNRKDIFPIFILGFFGIIIYHLGLNYGEQFISASVASLIIATIPIFVVIMASIYLKEKITIKIIIGILFSLIGVIIISIYGTTNTKIEIEYITGALGVLIAAIVGAGYTIAGKKMLNRYSALSLTVYAMMLGSIGLLPFLSISFFEQISSLSIHIWFAVTSLALFSTVISYVFWYMALELKDASELSAYLYFIPVLSTLISFLFFNENITLMFIFGGGLVITGLLIVNKKRQIIRE